MTLFSNLEMTARDPIFSINAAFQSETNPNKVNLAIGIYLDAMGKVPLLNAIQHVEKKYLEKELPHIYLPIEGNVAYSESVKRLLFATRTSNDIVTIQTPGGTGALNIGAQLLEQLVPGGTVAISAPTWENHRGIFELSNFKVVEYPYYDSETFGIDFIRLLDFIQNLPERSILVLHACCHNPTGNDLSITQWEQIIAVCQERTLIPFIDMAYQGFGSGLHQDRQVLDTFVDSGLSFFVANSFSKNFSLYGERVGALSIVTQSNQEAEVVLSHIKRLARATYSNPPSYGATLVNSILNDVRLFKSWSDELESMRIRIETMRMQLVESLTYLVTDYDFSYIRRQKGMFSYTGLNAEQVDSLRNKYGIYILSTGRLCVAALTENNIKYVSDAIAQVIRK